MHSRNKRLPGNTTQQTHPPFGLQAGFAVAVFAAAHFCVLARVNAQSNAPSTATTQIQSIEQRLHGLRAVPDEKRPASTKELALEIRNLSPSETKVTLALNLANLSTEGDAGRAVLQAVATTLEQALREKPDLTNSQPYVELAVLVRYEGVQTSAAGPQYSAAMARLEETDRKIENADFTLIDLDGKAWSLKTLRQSGKVVLVNFWATWCPPCRKELPDLTALSRVHPNDLLILGISDEKPAVLRPFVEKNSLPYPILLDTNSKLHDELGLMGIPCSLVYGKNGRVAATAMDMRTRHQLEEMLRKAGLTAEAGAK